MSQNSEHIIQACLAQDRAAQQQLFSNYNKTLFVSACTYLNDEELAKEITQQTWIDIFKGLQNYNADKSQLITWMKTIMIRKIWKLNANKKALVDLESVMYMETQQELVIAKMSCDEILNELERIPKISRMVFKMYVLDGYKHKEIADFLDITESTSRVHLTKARRIMQARYVAINQIVGE